MRERALVVIPAILAVLALSVILVVSSGAGGGSASEPVKEARLREIVVRGEGEVKAKPDVAFIQVGVMTQDKSLASAQTQNARLMRQVIDSLQAEGITKEDLQTLSYRIEPVRRYPRDGGEPEIVGYQVSNRLQVTTARLETVGVLIDTAVKSGANLVDGIWFSVEDQSALIRTALEKAAAQANDKAHTLAKSFGATLGRVTFVSDQVGDTPPIARGYYEKALAAAPSVAPTPVEPGDISVRAIVEARYELN